MRRLYLDHNASSPLRPGAAALARRLLGGDPDGGDRSPAGLGGNPSSAHAEGRDGRRQLEQARERLAALVGCEPDELVFTSGGSESNVWALKAGEPGWIRRVAATEHPSVLDPARRSPRHEVLAVDSRGLLADPAAAVPADGEPAVVSVARANHETGVLQDVAALAAARDGAGPSAGGLVLHCDATQAFGRLPLDVAALGADLVTLSAHKLGGPVGVGALVVRRGTPLEPLHPGGPQEGGLRAGTESVLLAQLFAEAAEEAAAAREEEARRHREWVAQVREGIAEREPGAIFLSPTDDCLPNTLCVAFPGRPGPSLVHRLDLEGVAVSHGSACASGSLEPSPVVLAMGHDEDVARSCVRISFGHTNVDGDVERLLEHLARALDAVAPRGAQKKIRGRSGD